MGGIVGAELFTVVEDQKEVQWNKYYALCTVIYLPDFKIRNNKILVTWHDLVLHKGISQPQRRGDASYDLALSQQRFQ